MTAKVFGSAVAQFKNHERNNNNNNNNNSKEKISKYHIAGSNAKAVHGQKIHILYIRLMSGF